MLAHDLLRRSIEARAAGGADRGEDQALPIRAHLDLGFPVDVKQVENGLLDDDAEAVADRGEFLGHGGVPIV